MTIDLRELGDEGMQAFKDSIQCARDAIEVAVLMSISQGAGGFGPTEAFWHFSHIESDTGLNREYVRAACRSLTDQGFAQYSNMLSTEDGDFKGAGYAATRAGINRLLRTGTERESVTQSVTPADPASQPAEK